MKGKDNSPADALSRIDIQAVHQLPPSIDFHEMAAAQKADQELTNLRNSTSTSLKLVNVPIDGTEHILVCDYSTGKSHPYVPLKFRRPIFDLLHCLSHSGVTLHSTWSHPIMFGLKSTPMSGTGPVTAFNANAIRFSDTP